MLSRTVPLLIVLAVAVSAQATPSFPSLRTIEGGVDVVEKDQGDVVCANTAHLVVQWPDDLPAGAPTLARVNVFGFCGDFETYFEIVDNATSGGWTLVDLLTGEEWGALVPDGSGGYNATVFVLFESIPDGAAITFEVEGVGLQETLFPPPPARLALFM